MVRNLLPDPFEEWTVLRPSWFMQNFTGSHPHAASAREHGVVVSATGRGRLASIDAADIAAVAARALTAAEPIVGELILTGPEPLSCADVTDALTRMLDRPVRHAAVTVAELAGMLERHMPAPFAAMLASLDGCLARGTKDRTTDTVERLTGRPPRPLAQVPDREAAG